MFPVKAVLYESCLLTVHTVCQLERKMYAMWRQAKAFVRKLWMQDSLLLRHVLLIPTSKLSYGQSWWPCGLRRKSEVTC